MTTKWEVPMDLCADKTVAVLATGPSLTQALADSVKQYPRIAVRSAYKLAPDAEMLVALDGPGSPIDGSFWDEAQHFAGIRVCGVEHDDLDALYLNLPHETVTLGEGHVIQIRNNGLAAIRLAAMVGAKKIMLLGFDTERYEELHDFTGLTVGLDALIEELKAQGIEVERVGNGTFTEQDVGRCVQGSGGV